LICTLAIAEQRPQALLAVTVSPWNLKASIEKHTGVQISNKRYE